MNIIIRKILNFALRIYLRKSIPRRSFWRTLFFNYYFLPYRQAKKLPIFVYGKLKLIQSGGTIEIDCPDDKITKGMIHLNEQVSSAGASGADTVIALGKGKIIFEGKANITRNSKFLFWGGGILRIGEDVYINNGADISCCNQITIGHHSRFGHNVWLTDTAYHFTYNTADNLVKRNNAPIVLGHHCWIGAKSTIMKGVHLPPFTTVASNSLVNKSIVDKEGSLLAGSPAKLIREGFKRVFNKKKEWEIAAFFDKHPEAEEYKLTEPLSQYD